jgi:hypothetical protein
MHDYLREIYFDFCLKNDMPKHNDAYLSADDYLNGNFQLINSQVYWLKNFVRLWNILESTWFDRLEEEVLAEDFRKHGLSTAHKEVR